MSKVKGTLVKIGKWRPMAQPIGKAAIYSAGFGLQRGLSGVLASFLPLDQILGAQGAQREAVLIPALLALLVKTKAVEKVISAEAAEVIAFTAWLDAFSQSFDIAGMVQGLFTPLMKGPAAAERGFFTKLGSFLTGGGFKGLGDIDTVIPVEADEEVMGFGADDDMLTSLEGKMAAIAG
jgi:hypothetical protein